MPATTDPRIHAAVVVVVVAGHARVVVATAVVRAIGIVVDEADHDHVEADGTVAAHAIVIVRVTVIVRATVIAPATAPGRRTVSVLRHVRSHVASRMTIGVASRKNAIAMATTNTAAVDVGDAALAGRMAPTTDETRRNTPLPSYIVYTIFQCTSLSVSNLAAGLTEGGENLLPVLPYFITDTILVPHFTCTSIIH